MALSRKMHIEALFKPYFCDQI